MNQPLITSDLADIHPDGSRGLILNINQKIDLVKLLSAEGAAFDSHVDELDARCHPDTRIDLLRQIMEWAQDPQGKCIFWLNGSAGTGKLVWPEPAILSN